MVADEQSHRRVPAVRQVGSVARFQCRCSQSGGDSGATPEQRDRLLQQLVVGRGALGRRQDGAAVLDGLNVPPGPNLHAGAERGQVCPLLRMPTS